MGNYRCLIHNRLYIKKSPPILVTMTATNNPENRDTLLMYPLKDTSIMKAYYSRDSFNSLFKEKKEKAIPEIQYLNLNGIMTLEKGEIPSDYLNNTGIEEIKKGVFRFKKISIAEYIAFGNLDKNSSAYPYSSKIYANEQGLKSRVRYATQKDEKPIRVQDIDPKNGRVKVSLKCPLCGKYRTITISKKNRGRKTPICTHPKKDKKHDQRYRKAQPMIVLKVNRI